MIDEDAFLVYNSRMEQKTPEIGYTERNTAKRRIIRSDGALYLLLLLLTFGLVALTYVLAQRLQINRLYLQIGLYAVLLAVGYAVYRLRLVDYLYELTDQALVVSQTVGNKQKRIAEIPFSAIEEIGAYRKDDAVQAISAYRGKKDEATAIWFREDGNRQILLLNASETLKEKLTEAMYARD